MKPVESVKYPTTLNVLLISDDIHHMRMIEEILSVHFNQQLFFAHSQAALTQLVSTQCMHLILYDTSFRDFDVLSFFETWTCPLYRSKIPILLIDALKESDQGFGTSMPHVLDRIAYPLVEYELVAKLNLHLKEARHEISMNEMRQHFVDACVDAIMFLDSSLHPLCCNTKGEELFLHYIDEKQQEALKAFAFSSSHFEEEELFIKEKTYLFSKTRFPEKSIKLQWHDITMLKEQETLLLAQNRFQITGEMLAHISHQWRQPLNALSLLIATIEEDVSEAHAWEQRMHPYFVQCRQQIAYMSQTIDDFRHFYKPNVSKEWFCPFAMIEHLLVLMRPTFKDARIECSVRSECHEAGLCNQCQGFFTYKNLLQQCLLNLISNAKDAIVATKRAQGRIEIVIDYNGEAPRLSVCDNGGGITLEPIDTVFKPYVSTKGPKMGTGLGLYMVKTIVEKQCGGHITATNTKEGACMCIELPKEIKETP